MHYAVLVTVGESPGEMHDFLQVLQKHFGGDLEHHLDVRRPFVMIENIPCRDRHRNDVFALRDELDLFGFTVWAITEPNPAGHTEVIYARRSKRGCGIRKLGRFPELPRSST